MQQLIGDFGPLWDEAPRRKRRKQKPIIRKSDIRAVRKLFKRKSAVSQLKAKRKQLRKNLAEQRARIELRKIKASEKALQQAKFRETKFKAKQAFLKVKKHFAKKEKSIYD